MYAYGSDRLCVVRQAVLVKTRWGHSQVPTNHRCKGLRCPNREGNTGKGPQLSACLQTAIQADALWPEILTPVEYELLLYHALIGRLL